MLTSVNENFQLMQVSVESSVGQQAVHSPVIKKTNRIEFTQKLNSAGLNEACRITSIRQDQIKTKVKRTIRGFLGKQKRMIIRLIKTTKQK